MRQMFRLLVTVLLIAGACGSAFAIGPADLVDLTNPALLVPESMVLQLGFGTPEASLVPGSVIYTGAFRAAGTFTNGLADGLGLESGIVLTTGSLLNDPAGGIESVILGPSVFHVGTENLTDGDPDLSALVGALPDITYDASALSFEFSTATATSVTFNFVFGSEEYNENVANDVFALFVNGVNYALVPGTLTPVSVFNLNETATPAIFKDNDPLTADPTPFASQLDGFSVVLAATVPVTPGQHNVVKIAIQDVGVDAFADSAVFIAPVIIGTGPVTCTAFAYSAWGPCQPGGTQTRTVLSAFPVGCVGGTPVTTQSCAFTPTFQDVPAGSFAFDQIEAIVTAGITAGCSANPPLFCPNDRITRGEMAVFLETSLGVTPAPPCAGNVFSDVTADKVGAAFCGYIEDLAARGITAGCSSGPGSGNGFCPDQRVSRAQMAVFIEVALGNPPNACTGTVFADVTADKVGATFCGFIERFAADGLTAGCGGGDFCPNDPVTRAEMAVFLVAAPPPLEP